MSRTFGVLTASASTLLSLTLILGACATEEPAAVKERASSSKQEGKGVVEEGGEPSDQDATASLGDTVTVGDWDVNVTKVLLNGNAQIAAENQFNDKPKGQYVLITYEATYTGAERTADAFADLSWSFTTTDSQIHDTFSVVTVADNEEWPTEARSGGTVRGQEVFDIQPSLTKGGILTVEGYDDDFDTVYADFRI